jgi:hypothetical protein
MRARAARHAKYMHGVCPHCRSVRRLQMVAPVRAFQYEPTLAPVEKPTVRVRLSVPFRVPKRQMLCVGGDKLPFGWSFMSIAHVPMTWNPGDFWTVEVRTEPVSHSTGVEPSPRTSSPLPRTGGSGTRGKNSIQVCDTRGAGALWPGLAMRQCGMCGLSARFVPEL